MMSILIVILGLATLITGAKLVLRGLAVAHWFRLTPAFIGLTIVAIGTDLPEIFVVGVGAIGQAKGMNTSGLVLGEIVGTVLSQATLILGIAGLIGTITLTKKLLLRDGTMMIISSFLLFFSALDGTISRLDGLALIAVYILYLFMIAREERREARAIPLKNIERIGPLLYLCGGLALLCIASYVTVTHALLLSERFHVSQALVGLLLVGLGTSLPELAATVTAMKKNQGIFVFENLVGSNIFDMLFVVGLGAVIAKNLTVPASVISFDFPFLIVACILATLLLRTRMKLSTKEAIALIVIFVSYFVIRAAFGFAHGISDVLP